MADEYSGGIAGVKIKIMPDSPEADMEKIKHNVRSIVEEEGGINNEYKIEPVAFGLKSLVAFFQWPEEKPLEKIEEEIKTLDHIQSVQVIDIRKIA